MLKVTRGLIAAAIVIGMAGCTGGDGATGGHGASGAEIAAAAKRTTQGDPTATGMSFQCQGVDRIEAGVTSRCIPRLPLLDGSTVQGHVLITFSDSEGAFVLTNPGSGAGKVYGHL